MFLYLVPKLVVTHSVVLSWMKVGCSGGLVGSTTRCQTEAVLDGRKTVAVRIDVCGCWNDGC